MEGINWLAVVAAAVSAFVLGGLWYSPALFAKPFMREAGLTDADLAKGSPAIIFGVSFVLALIAAAVFAMFLGAGALAWIRARRGLRCGRGMGGDLLSGSTIFSSGGA